ncbi:lytic murein transglycosylase [Nitratireductor aquimarinus]|uniref:lytic murein transglycosylase n=1 Tax=Nitratireductor TaxID=245876 RepID=UPI0019D3ED41|nr:MULTISPECIES: lytic murein transglycosylase [Nitratireductor]MBN7775509.1 lytic murein transglycosylase [Nitratireductor pacificus]MBN7782025.1 lytic murein transglycosylase [Nitratireductor pacificus]MBN7790832.1 lytic murein transglycosylase [Nitratireductor aquimarinus]MBN8243342.1 lytic murein transglycosylase [Nitratireductor aquimarinus]MBY6100649.1 lytic murein transglycosylase [Nitratireductor aquimarinus]
MFQRMIRLLVILSVSLAAGAAAAQSVETQFRNWLASDLWPEAQRRGISANTFNAAFANVSPNLKLPDLVLPGESKPRSDRQHQAEFRAPSAYFKHIGGVVSGGRARAGKLNGVLSAIEKRYGVPRGVVLAVWGRESGFGGAKIPYDAFEVLGTKAFLATRKAMFREEVLAALEMVERRGVSPRAMRSSWAGAMGQPQFMPTSYLKYAVDGDGNGSADIWNSQADTLASIANYLAQHGWVRGRDWGFEVTVPQGVSCALEGPDRGKSIADWQALGIRRVGGKAFPEHELRGEGYLMMPAGRFGPAFIVTPNFYRLKDYNESDLYALFVGHAGDRIMYGNNEFATSWGRVGGFNRSDVAGMQRGLERLGYDVGGADGLVGFKTRRSIGEWQQKNGVSPTCFPESQTVRRLQ